jgi:hypothetical protein
MTGKLKAFGLALVAAMALGAVSASAASAVIPQAHSGSGTGTTYLTGFQVGTNQLDTEGGKNIKCSTVKLAGSYAGTTSNDIKIVPTYSGCTAFGFTAHIEMMGCYYTLQSPAVEGTPARLQVNCKNEFGEKVFGPITVVATQTGGVVCTAHFDEQPLPLNLNVANNAGTPDHVTLTPESSTINYTVTGGGIKCGNEGAHADGKYTGSITGRAYSNESHAAQVNLTYN